MFVHCGTNSRKYWEGQNIFSKSREGRIFFAFSSEKKVFLNENIQEDTFQNLGEGLYPPPKIGATLCATHLHSFYVLISVSRGDSAKIYKIALP